MFNEKSPTTTAASRCHEGGISINVGYQETKLCKSRLSLQEESKNKEIYLYQSRFF